MIKLTLLVILIISLWYPSESSLVFIITVGILECYLLFAQYIIKQRPSLKLNLTQEEEKIFIRYHVYFLYPFTSRKLSSTMSGIQLSIIFWVPWLIYNSLWIPAIIIGLNYFVAGPLVAVKLNPRFFLHDAVERLHKISYTKEMLLVDSICEKILKFQNT